MGKSLFFKTTILASLVCASSWLQAQTVARVAVSVGDARKFSPSGQNETLQVGATLMAGDRIRTGPNGVAILVFTDEGRISLRADSELLIRHYEIDPAGVKTRIELELLKGTVRQISGNASRAQPDRYRLNTPVAVIGVRGTDFLAKTAGDSVEAFVHEGKIVFTPAKGCDGPASCAPLVVASSDNPLRYIRLSTDGKVEQREFRQGELEKVFGIEVARNSPAAAGANTVANAPGRRNAEAEAQPPEGTRLVSSSIFMAYTKGEVAGGLQTLQNDNALHSPNPLQQPLVWGRFTGADALPENFLPFAQASQDRHVTVGELGQYALWRSNPSGRLSPDLKGEANFRLTSADAILVQPQGVSTAQVTAASLSVNFDTSTFKAGVAVLHPLTGQTDLSASGRVNDEGMFVGTNASTRVAGALTRDGAQAGYLFSKDVPEGQIRGTTLWKR